MSELRESTSTNRGLLSRRRALLGAGVLSLAGLESLALPVSQAEAMSFGPGYSLASSRTFQDKVVGSMSGRVNINQGLAAFMTTSSRALALTYSDGLGPTADLVDLSTGKNVATLGPFSTKEDRKESGGLVWDGGAAIFTVGGRTIQAGSDLKLRMYPHESEGVSGQLSTAALTNKPASGMAASGYIGDFQGRLARFDLPRDGVRASKIWRSLGQPWGSNVDVMSTFVDDGLLYVGIQGGTATGVYAITEKDVEAALKAKRSLRATDFRRLEFKMPASARVRQILTIKDPAAAGSTRLLVRGDNTWYRLDDTGRTDKPKVISTFVWPQVLTTSADGRVLYGRWNHWGVYYLCQVDPNVGTANGVPPFVAVLDKGSVDVGGGLVTIGGKEHVVSYWSDTIAVSAMVSTPTKDTTKLPKIARTITAPTLSPASATLVGVVAATYRRGQPTRVVYSPSWINDTRLGLAELDGYSRVRRQGVFDQGAGGGASVQSNQVETMCATSSGMVLLGTYTGAGVQVLDPAKNHMGAKLLLSDTTSKQIRHIGTGGQEAARPVCSVQMPDGRVAVGLVGAHNQSAGGGVALVDLTGAHVRGVAPRAIHYGPSVIAPGHNVVSMDIVSYGSGKALLVGTSAKLESASNSEPQQDALLVILPIMANGDLGTAKKVALPAGAKAVWAIKALSNGRIFAQLQFWSRKVEYKGKAVSGVHTLIELDPSTCKPYTSSSINPNGGAGTTLYPTPNGRLRRYGQIEQLSDDVLLTRSNVYLRKVTLTKKGVASVELVPGSEGKGELLAANVVVESPTRWVYTYFDGLVYARTSV